MTHSIVARPGGWCSGSRPTGCVYESRTVAAPRHFVVIRDHWRATTPHETGSTRFASVQRRFRNCEEPFPLCSVGVSSTGGKASVGAWCGSVAVMRSRLRSIGAAVSSAERTCRGVPEGTAAGARSAAGAHPPVTASALRTDRRYFPRHLERTPPGVLPGDGEQPVAARARDLERVLAQGRPRAALRADAVARSPREGRLRRVGDARDHGPELRAKREDLQEAARDGDLTAVHFQHALDGGRARHAVPRAAPQVAAGADPGAGPLFALRHGRPPGRMVTARRQTLRGARSVWREARDPGCRLDHSFGGQGTGGQGSGTRDETPKGRESKQIRRSRAFRALALSAAGAKDLLAKYILARGRTPSPRPPIRPGLAVRAA